MHYFRTSGFAHEEMLREALNHYGIEEITGEEHNPDILKFFNGIGHIWVQDDETAWCSAFVNYCAKVNGYQYSGKLTARSWLDVGDEIKNPKQGDVVVFWRESIDSWKGHVGLFIRDDGTKIWTLGGNQNNSVCIKGYPKERILAYRRLHKL